MGCDIHMVLEIKDGEGGWIGLHAFPYTAVRSNSDRFPIGLGASWLARNRDYGLFAELAGVRGTSTTGNEPRGLPDDISPLAKMMTTKWDSDGHSHTWLTMSEAWPLFVIHHVSGAILEENRKEVGTAMFGLEDYTGDEVNFDDFRLIIWFDN